MKPYAITISVVAVVLADDESHARVVAEKEKREIFSDAYGSVLQFSAATEMTSEEDLKRIDWDGQCFPYGGSRDKRLSEIMGGDQQ
jgi:hypothetical protein